MVRDLATDPYLPDIGSLTPHADEAEVRAYIGRNRGRHLEGRGWSFCIADPAPTRRSEAPDCGCATSQRAAPPPGTASRRERAGCRHEGLLRSWMEIGHRRADMEVYGAVRPEA